MRLNRALLFFFINVFCFVIEGSVGCKRNRNGENLVLFTSSSSSASLEEFKLPPSNAVRDLSAVRSGSLSSVSSSSFGAIARLVLKSQSSLNAQGPLLRLDRAEPIVRPVGPIIGDVRFEKAKNEEAFSFYTRVLNAQGNEIISSFCAQINMELTCWPMLIHDLKKSMKWPDLYKNDLVFCDDVSSDCDMVQQYLKKSGCGKVPVVYNPESASNDAMLYVNGLVLHVSANPPRFSLGEDFKDALDDLALYFQNNDAFVVHVMHQQILKAPASKQPALEKIMNLYTLFARRKSDLHQAFLGCCRERSDESSSVDYVQEFFKHIEQDASVIVDSWLRECQPPFVQSKAFRCAVCNAFCATRMKLDREVTECLEDTNCCDRCWADMDRDERVF